MRKWKSRMGIMLMVVMVCALFVPCKLYAKESASITVFEGHKDVEFRLYLLAEMDEKEELHFTETFQSYPIDWNQKSAEDWMGVAMVLDGYIRRDGVKPMYSGKTDAEGKLKFENLPMGMYLITGDSYEVDGTRYLLSPIIETLPYHTGSSWIYDLEIYAKERQTREGALNYNVVKIWNGESLSGEHPSQVTVQLLRDKEIYEEVVLSEENNWKHTFYELSGEYDWTVVEKEVWDDYSVKLEVVGNHFALINTYRSEAEGPQEELEGEKLPQTGQLWWPVTLLTAAGLLCIAGGIYMDRKREF